MINGKSVMDKVHECESLVIDILIKNMKMCYVLHLMFSLKIPTNGNNYKIQKKI